ncbi:WSC-domain-containing protein [Aureobasidium pullulans]|uniref:WSC-domain-containing protein n=1 Tax=Aureobasidium pullulans TaxID=5580 RepID=A0AB74K6Z1_AURPU|nr:WSC-domain-containing protein [Aureobasidium pullulans]THX35378.1 WSC-domain-containing protein [Aureobasidium pullulans]THX40612.1 WSC-domain-containing protein [Aureobasidium pullulans]TIA73699.1 WSC-domain-containing protein [Aureobasidium pullulans]
MSTLWQHVHGLSQTYCSSSNTGSDYDAGQQFFRIATTLTNIYQSNGACQQECAASYAFAIVQYQQCWCSNYAPADQLDVSECSQPCPGYPDESCGDKDNGLYGYIKLNLSPSGTQGSASSSSATSSAAPSSTEQSTPTSSSSPSSAPASSSVQSDTTVLTSVSVTVTVKQSASVVVSYVTPSSSSPPSTTSTLSTPTSAPSTTSTSFSITSTQGAGVTSSPSSTADTSSLSHTTFISTRVVTVSGGPVTQTVTSTAVVTPGAGSLRDAEQKGVSGGTVAGAVVGSVAGVALLLAGAFFLWRRNRSETSDPESPRSGSGSGSARRRMERNTSVLSKTGLLSSAGNAVDMEKFHDDSAAFGAAGHRYNNSESTAPIPTSPDGDTRRNSRPLVYDQRLNPAALMENWERNGSRASIGTMQDQRDYSRPLGVTNPDPVDD